MKPMVQKLAASPDLSGYRAASLANLARLRNERAREGRGDGLGDEELENPVVIAVDPGETTGWSLMMVHPDALVDPHVPILSNVLLWQHGQINCRGAGVDSGGVGAVGGTISGATGAYGVGGRSENAGGAEILGLIASWPSCAVVIEDFILRTQVKAREALSPVRVTSIVDFGLWIMGKHSYRQQPSEAKGTATDERMKMWGFYGSWRNGNARHYPGAGDAWVKSGPGVGMPHALDADRHALLFLRKAKGTGSKAANRKAEMTRREAWPGIYGGA